MQLFLQYSGLLKSGNAKKASGHKHNVRLEFHPQLKNLLQSSYFSNWERYISSGTVPTSIVGNISFVPVISQKLHAHASLEITIVRAGASSVITDIDNRLKTLFDALTVPQELPRNIRNGAAERVYCLFENDNLITGFNVKAEKSFHPSFGLEKDVDVHIRVTTSVSELIGANTMLA